MLNEYERFGKGRAIEQYKADQLAAVDGLKDTSDAELERKRGIYLSLMFQAEALGNPHELVELNEQKLERLEAIVGGRQNKKGRHADIGLRITIISMVVAALSLLLAVMVFLYARPC